MEGRSSKRMDCETGGGSGVTGTVMWRGDSTICVNFLKEDLQAVIKAGVFHRAVEEVCCSLLLVIGGQLLLLAGGEPYQTQVGFTIGYGPLKVRGMSSFLDRSERADRPMDAGIGEGLLQSIKFANFGEGSLPAEEWRSLRN